MRQLSRYLQFTVLKSMSLIFLIIMVLQYFIGILAELSSVGQGHYTVLKAFLVVLMQLPNQTYTIMPIVGFLGCIIGMGSLASHSELTLMRASGISIGRIAWSIAKMAILLILLVTIIGECIAPALQDEAEQIKTQALSQQPVQSDLTNVWFHSNNRFIRIHNIHSAGLIQGVMIYQFDGQQHLQQVITAKQGRRESGDRWQLQQVRVTSVSPTHVQTHSQAVYPLQLYLRPQLLTFNRHQVKRESIVTLLQDIAYRRHIGLATNIYFFSLWSRLLRPFSSILMICLAVPFAFGSLRDSSMTVRFIIGMTVGFFFYMINELLGPITMIYSFPSLAAAVLPLLLIMAGYFYLLYRVD